MKVHVLCFFEEKESLIFDFECVCVRRSFLRNASFLHLIPSCIFVKAKLDGRGWGRLILEKRGIDIGYLG